MQPAQCLQPASARCTAAPRPAPLSSRRPARVATRSAPAPQGTEPEAPTSSNVCKTCGAPSGEIPWGCNQEGRVAGGIGAVVGFDWWPIKAYKPCPKAAKAGVLYTRKGQITDEMLFGRRKDQQQQ